LNGLAPATELARSATVLSASLRAGPQQDGFVEKKHSGTGSGWRPGKDPKQTAAPRSP
jgi:hypothetical protein